MKKKILLSTIAQKQFKNLDIKTQSKIKNNLKKLCQKMPRSKLDIKKLRGIKGREDLYRLRIGKYRIIFYEDEKVIKIIQIIHRSRGYNWL